MEAVPADRRPIRAIGDGGGTSSGPRVIATDDRPADDPNDAGSFAGWSDEDDWPPHFGAARLGIP